MHFNKLIAFGSMMVLGGLVTMSGCNDMNGPGEGENGMTSSVQMAFTGAVSWEGNSVLITATRDGQADSKYRCYNEAEACFNFNADGTIEPATGQNKAAKAFDELCSSVDVPDPDYPGSLNVTFTYVIYAGENCNGTVINDENNTHDFVCYAADDFLTQDYPNQTANEELPPGDLLNKVLCVSENTDKDFVFISCAEIDVPEYSYATAAFDCGCVPDNYGGCNCGDLDPSADIDPSCSADPANYCAILCGP
ncbi:hypothetical protein [Polyangium sp. y55x31]|uniref:hypothetical protein n=1 Tax=Polyangium sp. y55x31 TaxID=3042688 RepID=UPI00248280BA|nr:hypothetical protein [Polyangium sp. y55x31]MDI1481130.1 hypothetical protein [Polyangium sp. y55x31]